MCCIYEFTTTTTTTEKEKGKSVRKSCPYKPLEVAIGDCSIRQLTLNFGTI